MAASGLNKALDEKYQAHDPENRRAYRVRCYVHKWRNITDVLTPKQSEEAAGLFWAIREARDLTQAMECAGALEKLLGKFNASALASFLEAKDDLLALHRLGLSAQLRRFFSTTNPIESLNSLLEEDNETCEALAGLRSLPALACYRMSAKRKANETHSGLSLLASSSLLESNPLCTHEKTVDRDGQAA